MDAADVAHNTLVRSAKAKLTNVLMRHEAVEVGLPNAEQVGLFAVLLREPPAVSAVEDTRLYDRRDLCLEASLAEHVVDLDPVTVGHIVLCSWHHGHGSIWRRDGT